MKKTLFVLIFSLFAVNSYAATIISPIVATANVNTANYALDSANLAAQPATYYTNASNLDAGTIPSARLNTAYVNMTGLGVSGNIGVTVNSKTFTINNTDNFGFQTVGDNSYVVATGYGTGNQGGFFVGRASNSATATPSTTAHGRNFLTLFGMGVASTNIFTAGCSITLAQDGVADTSGGVYGKIQFFTRTSGVGYTEKMTIRSNGYVGIAQPTPNATFELNGTQVYTNLAAQSLSAASQVSANAVSITVVGNGGAVDLTSNPQIMTPLAVGQRITIWGSSDTNTVKFDDSDGLQLAGGASFTLGLNDCIQLEARSVSPVIWAEISRSDN